MHTHQIRTAILACGLAAAAGTVVLVDALSASTIALARERHPQSAWAPCNRNAGRAAPSTFIPLSDRAAAALVTPQREVRRQNATPYTLAGHLYPAVNDDEPTRAQIVAFRRARTSSGQSVLRFNPYFRYVDGRDDLQHPTTDELIQWAAHKWGIPENWLRAEYVTESYWNAFQLGDEVPVSSDWYLRYPPQARAGNGRVFQSMGLTQVRWIPDGSVGAGTEPVRWESSAFDVDYQAAMVRFYYDDPSGARSAWGDAPYRPCERWPSIGGWFEPFPWANRGQRGYIGRVRTNLADRVWLSSSFVGWRPSSLPPGVKLR